MDQVAGVLKKIVAGSLVKQILAGIVAGVGLALAAPDAAVSAGLLGEIFVAALKAVAPILVFVIVLASIANQKIGGNTNMRTIILLYLV